MADIKYMWIDTLQSSRTNPKRMAMDIAHILGYMLGGNRNRMWIPDITTCQWFDKKLKNDLRLDYTCVSIDPDVYNWRLVYEVDGVRSDIVCISSMLDTTTIVNLMSMALCSAYVNGSLETEEDE